MLRSDDAEYMKTKVRDEGFGYAVDNFSGGVSGEDVKYHELLAAYRKAKQDLAEYIGVRVNP